MKYIFSNENLLKSAVNHFDETVEYQLYNNDIDEFVSHKSVIDSKFLCLIEQDLIGNIKFTETENKQNINEKLIIEKADEIAMNKAIEIVSRRYSDVTCMDAKIQIINVKNDIMDGVKICLSLI